MDKETSFLEFDIKVITSSIHHSVYDKRGDISFPLVKHPLVETKTPIIRYLYLTVSAILYMLDVVLAF